MISVEIKGFNPERLEELAEQQTNIYNEATAKLPNFTTAKVEDTIARFKKDTFDQSRMFYAYEGESMIGYVGLTGKNEKQNLRGVGFPWLRDGIDENVRDQLYDEMEQKCRTEGTKLLRAYASDLVPQRLNFYKNKGYTSKQEFLNLEKQLIHQDFTVPHGYTFRSIQKEDLIPLEEVSKNDPKMKTPFSASAFEQNMKSPSFNADNYVVAEHSGLVIGYFGLFISANEANTKAYFSGVAVSSDHELIEPVLIKEIENRAFARGKKKVLTLFFPDSPRLPFAKENGYQLIGRTYQLDKMLE